MKPSVRDAWLRINEQWEGLVYHFYLDILGLVTIGCGNLLEAHDRPTAEIFALEMWTKAGAPATRNEIEEDWHRVNDAGWLAQAGHLAAAKIAQLHTSRVQVEILVMRKLLAFERTVVSQFPEFPLWPADAQFGILSMAWAAGPHIFQGFPKFSHACREREFSVAAAECRLDDSENPGLHPRNVANRTMFINAAQVYAMKVDDEQLYYPGDVVKREPFAGMIPIPFPSISEYPRPDDSTSPDVDSPPSSSDAVGGDVPGDGEGDC